MKKYLPTGETLYRGSKVNITKMKGVKESKRNLRKKLSSTIHPKANKFILNQPYKVWWWFVIGEPKRKKGFKVFLREKLGEPPVLSSRIKPTSIAENMQALLENEGYFHSIVEGDTTIKKYYTYAKYNTTIFPQYTIHSIVWVSDGSRIMKELQSIQEDGSLINVSDGYSLTNITNERSRLDLKLKTKGYYYFNPNYLMAYVDSTIGGNQVDIMLNMKHETPDSAKFPYAINSITIYPNYNLLAKTKDTILIPSVVYDSLIIKENDKFNPNMFKRVVTYRPHSTYDITEQNKTLNRLINLGNFKFVKNVFSSVPDSMGGSHSLDAVYYLSPSKKKSFQGQIDGFSKENKFIGTLLSLNWKNRNVFKGAELLTIKAYGGLEVSYADSLKKNNNFRAGSEASLTFPRFIIPFLKIKESSFYTPHTRMLLGYEWFRKQGFYTKNVFRTQYEFNWKETANKEHSLAPIAISYINASNISQDFLDEAASNPAILTNVYSEAILGSFYSYTTNTKNQNFRDLWYFNGSIDLSGNIMGLITGANNTREKTILNTPFAQYAKGDIELRYLKKLKPTIHWANRLQIGASIPYNNSNMLPFSKQYIIGGSNSIRGFRIRQLGPGSYLPTLQDQTYYFIIGGDYKFLLNTELRLPIVGNLSTAFFIDAGNIWTKDTFLFGKAGQIKKDMYKELAVAGGFGVRYDFKILLIRFDFGTPLRKPFLPENDRWVFDKIDFKSGDWRRQNLILNIAIGYPF
ncbi:MAG: BamA/TamA family outer membrane protein [Bacteroidetes bacterium]|nr:BamA/TamA family outer membrane protein [Bacteroidota bacterium]